MQIRSERLSRSEEHDLATRWAKNGDSVARSRLVEANIGLVKWLVVKRFKRVDENLHDDLFSEGMAGLLYATTKYDPDSGHRFSTYGVYWAHQHMTRFLNEWKEVNAWGRDNQAIGNAVEIEERIRAGEDPEAVRKKFLTWKSSPTADLMVSVIQWTKPKISMDSTNKGGGQDRNGLSLHEVLEDNSESVADCIERRQVMEALDREIEKLPRAELLVISERLNGKTYEQAAKKIGKSREMARRHEASAIKKLQKKFKEYREAS